MRHKKVCLLGGYGVGKTAILQRYINSIFYEHYLSTIGVNISRISVPIDEKDLGIVLWDHAGESSSFGIEYRYLRGAEGFIVVADCTKASSIDLSLRLREKVLEIIPKDTPHLVLLNKVDLVEDLRLSDSIKKRFASLNVPVLKTSAKTGSMINDAFETMAKMLHLKRT